MQLLQILLNFDSKGSKLSKIPHGSGRCRRHSMWDPYLLTSPQAPNVLPMALMTEENTVFKSCFNTPCS